MLGDDFLTRPRLSRIYYDGKFFSYPLQARDVVSRPRHRRVGALRRSPTSGAAATAAREHRRRSRTGSTARFGKRLYDTFFRTYTEKVWGIPGSEIQAEWAAQRIKDFSLRRALLASSACSASTSTTLIEEFHYPRLGPGQMWERMQAARRGARHPGAPRPPRHVDPPRRTDVVTEIAVGSDGRARRACRSTPCSRASRSAS